jgi:hypothetical protein
MRLIITVGAKSYNRALAALERDVDSSLYELISVKNLTAGREYG